MDVRILQRKLGISIIEMSSSVDPHNPNPLPD